MPKRSRSAWDLSDSKGWAFKKECEDSDLELEYEQGRKKRPEVIAAEEKEDMKNLEKEVKRTLKNNLLDKIRDTSPEDVRILFFKLN